jgi:YacP-like NYN domain
MHFAAAIRTVLFALDSQKLSETTWFVDGSNVLAHKGTPNDRETVRKQLSLMQGADAVILVFDGRRGDETIVAAKDDVQNVYLGEGISADDYIYDAIEALLEKVPQRRVQVITADRELRQRVLEVKPIVRGVVNPHTFWRRYLPRLCGFKLAK